MPRFRETADMGMKPVLLALALTLTGAGAALAQSAPMPQTPAQDFKIAACKGKGDGFYCVMVGNEHQKINCTNGKVAAQIPCPGGCVSATKECKQSTGADAPVDPSRPAASR